MTQATATNTTPRQYNPDSRTSAETQHHEVQVQVRNDMITRTALHHIRTRLPHELVEMILTHLLHAYIPSIARLTREVCLASYSDLHPCADLAVVRSPKADPSIEDLEHDAHFLRSIFVDSELGWPVRDLFARIAPLIQRMVEEQRNARERRANEQRAREAWYAMLGPAGRERMWGLVEEGKDCCIVPVHLRRELEVLERCVGVLGAGVGDGDELMRWGSESETLKELRRMLGGLRMRGHGSAEPGGG